MSRPTQMVAHDQRRGDRANPHRGDCVGTRCPDCDCCQHCTDPCPDCIGCANTLCDCPTGGGPMSGDADTLRRAATLIRERVQHVAEDCGVRSAEDVPWLDCTDDYASGGDAVHIFIASWHPAVALAVADLLDAIAQHVITSTAVTYRAALTVARHYLGEQP